VGYACDRLMAEHRRPIDLGPPAEGCLVIPPADGLAAVQWFTVEHSNVLSAQGIARSQGWLDRVWQFAWILDSFHWRRGHLYDDITSWRAGLTAARHIGNIFAIGLAHRRLGRAYGRANRFKVALNHMTSGLRLAEQSGDAPGQAHARRILSWICHEMGDDQQALSHANASLAVYKDLGNPVWLAHALNEVGVCYMRLGQYDTAATSCRRALDLHLQYRHRAGEAESADSLGDIMLATGQYNIALQYYQEALLKYRSLDNTYDEANVLYHLGRALTALDRREEGRQAWQEALSLYRRTHRIEEAEQLAERLEDSR
jgi:tetratricopeptide (TPR) repeat protein